MKPQTGTNKKTTDPIITTINIIQANLARSFNATTSLKHYQEENEHHISIVQEPYVLKNKIIGYPLKHNIIAHTQNPKVAIIIHNKDIQSFPLIIEEHIIATRIHYKSKDILLINCYWPPGTDDTSHLSKIETALQTIQHTEVLITGDFNAKNTLWGSKISDRRGENILEFLIKHNLTIENDKYSPPTFQTSRAKGWIDLTISNTSLHPDIRNWEVLKEFNNSDHRYIKFEIPIEHTKDHEKYGITLKGKKKILDDILQDPWFTENNTFNTIQDIEDSLTIFYSKLKKLTEKYTKKLKPPDKKPKPWWSTELEIERKKVRAMRRRYQRATGDIRQIYKKEYYKEHDTYNNMLNKAKDTNWETFCTSSSKNPFNLAYKLASKKCKNQINLFSFEKDDGNKTQSPQETAEYILTKLFPVEENESLQNEETQNQTKDTQSILQSQDQTINSEHSSNNSGRQEIPFTVQEVDNAFQNLRKKVASGPDNLQTEFTQAVYNKHKQYFLNLYNACLKLGHYPNIWKTSRVILIHKANWEEKCGAGRYRPIAINSNFGKVLEKLIKDRLYYFLFKGNHIHKNQFGFRHKTSTTHALLEIKKRIVQSKIDKHNCLIISLDIKNAFNGIKATNITDILQEYKCPLNMILIIQSILTNRQIRYEQNNILVNKTLKTGSPQGSPLSPLLWNLTMNKLLQQQPPEDTYLMAFADDITIIVKAKSRNSLETKANQVLQQAFTWAQDMNLTFNTDKSNFMIIGKQYESHPPQLTIEGKRLKIVKELKMLGVIFDTKMSFIPHLQNIKDKVATLTYQLSKFTGTRKAITPKQLTAIYTRGIERMIVYASPVWYSKKIIITKKLKSIQRLPLILLTKAFKTTSNYTLNILSNIPPVSLTIEKEIEVFQIFSQGKNFTWKNTAYTENQISSKYDLWEFHPATHVSFRFTDQETNANVKIYTDGSKNDENVGAALVAYNKTGQIINTQMYKLPPYSSSFEGEAIALTKAIEYIKTCGYNNTYQILTDSLSCLQGLQNLKNNNPLIVDIKKRLSEIPAEVITLTFIKGHSGNKGNDMADTLAKEASTVGEQISLPITKTFIKSQLKTTLKEKWNNIWQTEGKHSYAYEWIKNVKLIPEEFLANTYISQAISGHGRFPHYFSRFNLTNSTKCPCDQTAYSFDHYLQTCTLTQTHRNKLIKLLGANPEKRKPEIIKNKQALNIIEEMMKTIIDNTPQV